jgi:hypothetical protein
MKHLEGQLHKQINQYLSILLNQDKIDFYSYDASGEYRTKITGALLKAKGLKKGKPDFMVLHTNLGGITYVLWLEAKAGTNKQTEEQIEFEARASLSKNEIYKVVRDIEEVQKAFNEFRRISV